MKVLLVVGLAAVIIVILIAVILSVRLGRGDDHEEPVTGGRGRRDADDPRWRERDMRESRRPLGGPARSARGSSPRQLEAAGRQRDRGDRPERDQPVRARDYRPQRRGDRYDTGPGYDTGPNPASSARRPVAATAPRSGSRDYADRRPGGTGRDRYDTGPALYDTGPSPRTAAGDFPSGPFPAAEFPSDSLPAVDFPAAGYPDADFPSEEFSSREFPSGPLAAADFPAREFPSGPPPAADFPPAGDPADDFPSGELPAPRARGKSAMPAADPGRDRQESRRKQAKPQGSAKGRSAKPRGKRDDDDDWPSMAWEKLSDEQYWAELSSDKPLSTTARSPQPASEARPAAAKGAPSRPASARPKPAASKPAAPAPAAAAEPARGRDLPSRKAPSVLREAVTERLPIRGRAQPAAHARAAIDPPPAARPAPPPPANEPSIAMLASFASAPPGALDEDPLTSPSFSRPAIDSRSYSSARKSAPSGDTGPHPRSGDLPGQADYGSGGYGSSDVPPNGHVSGAHRAPGHGGPAYGGAGYSDPGSSDAGYGDSGYGDPGYAYQAGHAQPGGWHSAEEHTPVQGNPYGSYVDPASAAYPSAAQAGYPDAHPGTGHPSYPAQTGGYPEPAYEPALSAPYPAPPGAGLPVQAADPGQFPPPAGYPDHGGYGSEHAAQAPHPEVYEDSPGYGPESYPGGYVADPYGHDGYGGYTAAQG